MLLLSRGIRERYQLYNTYIHRLYIVYSDLEKHYYASTHFFVYNLLNLMLCFIQYVQI